MNASKFILPAVFLAVTIVFGFLVSKSGKPYNAALFNAHKLIALAVVVWTMIYLVPLLKLNPAQGLLLGLLLLAALSVIALFATGAIMSIQKTLHLVWRWVHTVAVILLAGSGVSLVYLILKK